MPMKIHPDAPRNTGGFSLDDAARVFRTTLRHDQRIVCPTCRADLHPIVGDRQAHSVWILRCDHCGSGVVFRHMEWRDLDE